MKQAPLSVNCAIPGQCQSALFQCLHRVYARCIVTRKGYTADITFVNPRALTFWSASGKKACKMS